MNTFCLFVIFFLPEFQLISIFYIEKNWKGYEKEECLKDF